jgi:hypothetical protein
MEDRLTCVCPLDVKCGTVLAMEICMFAVFDGHGAMWQWSTQTVTSLLQHSCAGVKILSSIESALKGAWIPSRDISQ